MSLCLAPDCSHKNAPTDKFCQKCRFPLLLKDRYRAIRLIGQGGFGKTFQAVDEDKPSKPYCVIKQFFPQARGTATLQKAAELFQEEAIRLDSLGKHTRIPELYAYFTAGDGRQYLVQEYIEGQNLERELKEEGVFNEAKIRQLLTEILPILEFIHGKQVIHRDIKPENIIRRKVDNKLILVDFGASKLVTTLNRSVTGTVIGSAEFVAPEQSIGKAVNASDLYSLGVTCIYLLTGISPFDLFDVGEGKWIWRQSLVNNPVSDELGKVLDQLIESATKRRFQSTGEVLEGLNCEVNNRPKVSSPSVFSESEKGVDYTKLRDLLAKSKWKEADEETAKIILQAVDRTKEGLLRLKDLENFPCKDLQTINRMWVHYSNGRFGFSVQKKIYKSLGGTIDYNEKIWKDFGKRVGWIKSFWGTWVNYENLVFDLKAPEGHLPRMRVGIFSGNRAHLFSRMEICKI